MVRFLGGYSINKVDKFYNYYESHRISAATDLFDTIIRSYMNVCNGVNNKKTFQTTCLDAIKDAKVELEGNRDVFPQLVNLLAIITILPALIMKLFTGQSQIMRTDSSKKVQNLKEKLQSLQFQEVAESNEVKSVKGLGQ